MSKEFSHETVLLHEAVVALNVKADGFYVDATFGRGGHSAGILRQLGEEGKLLMIDKDPVAIAFAKENYQADTRVVIQQGSFKSIDTILQQQGLSKPDGILLDLGVSSPQLDDATRGFSFMRDGDLDMRMDFNQGQSAKAWLNLADEAEIADVIYQFGEEHLSRRIARRIVMEREQQDIVSTGQLASIVAAAVPRAKRVKGKHPATKTFQAIRIFINQELEDLKVFLDKVESVMAPAARLVVISFHSLEDRMVKQFIRSKSRAPAMPRGLPVQSDFKASFKRLGKAIKATEQEVQMNTRARSAVMRIAERCG